MTTMTVHDVQQGSPEWHALRAQHFCASEAAAMMGVSPYMTRSALLRQKATGIIPEVDAATQRRFDDGHATEAAFRPAVERIIGEDLYPVVGTLEYTGLPLLASFDGLTMDWQTGYEHKRINNDLRALRETDAPLVPDQYVWQLEQQMLVSGARGIWFCASDGTEGDCLKIYYESDPELRARLISGWRQFSMDLHNYQPEPAEAPKPAGVSPESLPALRIELSGAVTASNLQVYKEAALTVFAGINRELTTDQHFADAEKTVKWCGDIEDRIKAAKQHALSQTASIDELFRTMDEISDQARAVRLELDKLVKARKDAVRVEIVNEGRTALLDHVEALNRRLGKPYMPAAVADFAGAIKGKRTVTSLRDAVAVTLANAKIAASATADKIDANLKTLRELAAAHAFLFADTAQIVMKDNADLVLLINARIADHKAAKLEAQNHIPDVGEMVKPVSQPNPETVAQAAPAFASVSPQLSVVGAAFLASRHWPNEAARNTARSVVIEYERFCAQQEKAAA